MYSTRGSKTFHELMGLAVRVREMLSLDIGAVAELSGQLGYSSTTAEVTRRFLSLNQNSDDGLFVSLQNANVVGWLHVYGVRLLETDGYAEIGGLVVDVAVRRRGVGRQLVAQAESWAAARGYGELRLRSGLHRSGAHEFYSCIGYELAKTSHMFRKEIHLSR